MPVPESTAPSDGPSPPGPAKEAPPPAPAADDEYDHFRLGALAGVGFPRPIAFEAFARFGRYVGLGVEYGMLPSITIDPVNVSSWAVSVDTRVFPLHGAFYVGVRGGYQQIAASSTVVVSGYGSANESADLDTWFLNPRIGFLWRTKYAFTIGIDAGVQLPVTSSFSTTLPSAVAMVVRSSTPVTLLSGVLPTVDLLRVGFLF
jgi:hypothetical protein